MTESVDGVVDHLFRRSAGQMVATLTRIFGSEHISLAEEVVQDALVSALQQWSLGGIPENPAAWLFRVARNRAIDHVRRDRLLQTRAEAIEKALYGVAAHAEDGGGFSHELQDDQLQMMLMACHRAIPEDSRIALTLKAVGGFSVDEIAAAFLAKRETIAQRVVRAKRLIRDEKIPMELPSRHDLAGRVDSLLKVLYLMFNEGYSAHAGDELVRADVCAEAIRLTRLVAGHPAASSREAHALAALMLLQGARLRARVDAAGELATLADQDRSLWDRAMIRAGLHHLDCSAEGEDMTAWHIEAAIAACHSTAPDFASTDWQEVIRLYDELLTIKPSPVVALNRAVALSVLQGPQAGIRAVEQIASHNSLRDYLPLATTLGELWLQAGDRQQAATHFARALELPSTTLEKRFLLRKLESCTGPRPEASGLRPDA